MAPAPRAAATTTARSTAAARPRRPRPRGARSATRRRASTAACARRTHWARMCATARSTSRQASYRYCLIRYFSTAVALSASLTWGVHVPLLQGARCEVDKCASQVSGTHAGLIVGQDLCSGAGCHAYGSLLVVVEFRTRCRRVERTAATTLWQPFAAVTAQAPGLLVPFSGFLASRRRKQRNNGGKMSKNGRDIAGQKECGLPF